MIVTDKPAPGLKPLSQSRGFRLHAPLDDVVTADVEIIVGGVDVAIPLEQARFIVADGEADAETMLALKRRIEARRAAAKAAAMMERTDTGGTFHLDVNPRWWARARVCRLLWKIVCHMPSWAFRIRRVSPPAE